MGSGGSGGSLFRSKLDSCVQKTPVSLSSVSVQAHKFVTSGSSSGGSTGRLRGDSSGIGGAGRDVGMHLIVVDFTVYSGRSPGFIHIYMRCAWGFPRRTKIKWLSSRERCRGKH